MAKHVTVELKRVLGPTDEVVELLRELDGELSLHYPPEQRHALSLDALFQPHILFFQAEVLGKAVGCGGVGLFGDFAELKRMYVRPGLRGQGVAAALVERLEAEAKRLGYSVMRLETGVHQIAAIRFYERSGYVRCGAFEPYSSKDPQSIATSVFLQKSI